MPGLFRANFFSYDQTCAGRGRAEKGEEKGKNTNLRKTDSEELGSQRFFCIFFFSFLVPYREGGPAMSGNGVSMVFFVLRFVFLVSAEEWRAGEK